MNATENAIETKDLTKVCGKRIRAVNRLNLTISRGEVYGFLGPNGAGKTTTMQMLLGLVRATCCTSVPGSPAVSRRELVIKGASQFGSLAGRKIVTHKAGTAVCTRHPTFAMSLPAI
jgi:ABC-type uncharacterized transport system ATPase subunit